MLPTMKRPYDFNAVVYNGDVYCVSCLPEGVTQETDDVTPIFADENWDHIPTCCECGEEHDYVNVAVMEEVTAPPQLRVIKGGRS